MNKDKIEGLIEIFVSIFVLFSAMLKPEWSLVIAIIALAGLGIYNLIKE